MATIRYLLKVFIYATRGIIQDECFYKASALTFYTLLSIVPILAIALGIAKGVGLEHYLEQEINARFLEQPEISHQMIIFAYAILSNTHGGIIALLGVISLLWTSLQLLSNVELSLNYIWRVKSRAFLTQISYYSLILFLVSVIVITSSALSVYFIKYSYQISYLFKIFPFIMNWILFASIYHFLPNTLVKWKYAIPAGIIAGTAYQIVQWIYIHFQIGVASYGAIYGSFAALPLFLVWVNTSWTIVLAGAEIAFNLEVTPKVTGPHQFQYATQKQIGLWLTAYCTQEFLKGNPPTPLSKIESMTGLPQTVVKKVSQILGAQGILDEDQHSCLLLAKSPEEIKLKEIIAAFDKYDEKYPVTQSSQILQFDQAIEDLEKQIIASPFNKPIKDLLLMKERIGESG